MKKKLKRVLAGVLTGALMLQCALGYTDASVVNAASPVIGANENFAAGKNVPTGFTEGTTQYLDLGDIKTTKENPTWYYSGTYQYSKDTGDWKGLKFIFGLCSYNSNTVELAVSARLHSDGFTQILVWAGDDAPYVADVAGNVYNQVNTDYTLTIRMSGTKLSLWINDKLLVEDFDLGGKNITNIVPKFGLNPDGTNGAISDLQVWGDLSDSSSSAPTLGTNENLTAGKTMPTEFKEWTTQYLDLGTVKITKENPTYYYSGTYKYTLATDAWMGLKFIYGQGTYNGTPVDLAVSARLNGDGNTQVLVWAGDAAPHGVDITGNIYNQVNTDYTLTVRMSGTKLSLWINDKLLVEDLDLGGKNVTNIVPKFGFYPDGTTGTLANLQVWGDLSTKSAPVIGTNENLTTGKTMPTEFKEWTTQHLDLGDIKTTKENPVYYYSGTYKYTVATSAWMGLKFIYGQGTYNGSIVDLAVSARLDGDGNTQVLVWAGDEAPHVVGVTGNVYNQENTDYTLTVRMSGTKVSLWIDDKLLVEDLDLGGKNITNIVPKFGFHPDGTTGILANLQVWGDLKIVTEEDKAPTIGDNKNLAEGKNVPTTFNGTTTQYIDMTGVKLTKENPTWYFSGNYQYSEETGNWKGLKFVFGLCSYNGNTVELAVSARLNGDGDTQILVWAGEDVVLSGSDIQGNIYNQVNTPYTLTVRMSGTKVSFWINNTLLIKNGDLSKKNVTNIEHRFGINPDGTNGFVSNLQVWGDMVEVTTPTLGTNTNLAVEENMPTEFVGFTAQYLNLGGVKSAKEDPTWYYKGKYQYGEDTGSWKGLKIIFGQGIHNGNSVDLAVSARLNGDGNTQVIVWAGNDALYVGELEGNIYNNTATDYGFAVKISETKVSFWINDDLIIKTLNLSNVTNITPQFGLNPDGTTGTISHIEVWGDLLSVSAPVFDSTTDTDLMEKVYIENPITGKIAVLQEGMISTESGYVLDSRMRLHGVEYGKSYNFTTSASFEDNTTKEGSVNWEGLIFKVATVEENGATYDVEVRFRSGGAIIFIGDKAIDKDIKTLATPYGTTNQYAVAYHKDNTFSVFKNGEAIFLEYDLTKEGYENVKPVVGFGGEVCSYTFTGLRLWGDVSFNEELVPEIPVEPIFDKDADINLMKEAIVTNPTNGKTGVLDNCELVTAKKHTESGIAEISALVYGKSYNFSTRAKFYDNTNAKVDYEGLVFKVATVEKNGKKHNVEVRFRSGLVGVFVDNKPYALDDTKGTAYSSENRYTISYHEDGTFSVFQDGNAIYYKYDITKEGYKNVQPAFGFGGEACAFEFHDMKLWGDIYLKELPKVPQKPASNGNYADYMRVPGNSVVTYEDGKIYTTSDVESGQTEFKYLPFETTDTYVFGFNVNTKKADKAWMGPRIIFGETNDGKNIALYIMESSIGVFVGDDMVGSATLGRELNQVYRVDMLIESNTVTVWVDNILLIEKCTLPAKAQAKMGVLFENTIAVISNMDLYYTDEVKFVVPNIPEPPVYKTIASNQYNAADWMKVKLNSQDYTGYFGNKLSSTDSSVGNKYLFENLPIADDMSYYYSATYKITESSEVWKGPRFIFRQDDGNAFYVAVLHDSILVLAESDQVASAPLKMELGKNYDIVMYTTPTELTIWVDGVLLLESVDLTPYINKKLEAKPGLLFELCQAQVTNIALYGDRIVFNKDYVDLDLYNDKYFRMAGIPAMTGLNLFQNIVMTDLSNGSIGAEFDSKNNILTTKFPEGSGLVTFQDATGSNHLNGLKNEVGYVLSFKYRVDDWQAEELGKSGLWVTTNASAGPWTKEDNSISVGFSGDAMMISVAQESNEITRQQLEFNRTKGREYDIAIVHGKNWIKLYVDNELKMVSTYLPTYDTTFRMSFSNAKTVIDDIKLYEFEDSGLEIYKVQEEKEVVAAGNTIYDADEYTFLSRIKMPWAIMTVATIIVLLCATTMVIFITTEKEKHKIEIEMEGDTLCEKEE